MVMIQLAGWTIKALTLKRNDGWWQGSGGSEGPGDAWAMLWWVLITIQTPFRWWPPELGGPSGRAESLESSSLGRWA